MSAIIFLSFLRYIYALSCFMSFSFFMPTSLLFPLIPDNHPQFMQICFIQQIFAKKQINMFRLQTNLYIWVRLTESNTFLSKENNDLYEGNLERGVYQFTPVDDKAHSNTPFIITFPSSWCVQCNDTV